MAGGGGLANSCVLSLSDSCVKAGQAVMGRVGQWPFYHGI